MRPLVASIIFDEVLASFQVGERRSETFCDNLQALYKFMSYLALAYSSSDLQLAFSCPSSEDVLVGRHLKEVELDVEAQ